MTDGQWGEASSYERAVLAALEASVLDSSPLLFRRFELLGRDRDRVPCRMWLALTLSWTAAVVILVTFSTSPPIAFAGLGAMAAGVLVLVASGFSSRMRHRVPWP